VLVQHRRALVNGEIPRRRRRRRRWRRKRRAAIRRGARARER